MRRPIRRLPAQTPALPAAGEGAEGSILPAPGMAQPGVPASGAGLPPAPEGIPYGLATIELVVSPLPTAREQERFQRVLQALAGSGLHAAQVRRVERGTLRVRLECTDITVLLHGLAAYYQPAFHIRSRDAQRVEIVLAAPEGPSSSTSRT